MTLPEIHVRSYDVAQEMLMRPWDHPPIKSVLSINDPSEDPPQGFHEFKGMKLCLLFHDIEHEYQTKHFGILPSEKDVEKILVFGRAAKGPILIHCAAGISRSPAAAVLVMSVNRRPSKAGAREIFDELLRIRPHCLPNFRMIDMGDALAGWKGYLVEEHIKRFSNNPAWR